MAAKRQTPSQETKSNRPSEARTRKLQQRRLRFNARAAAILAVVALLLVATAFGLRNSRAARIRSQVIAEALGAEKSGNVDQSIRSLRRYLDAHPDDLGVLEALARIMYESARSSRNVDDPLEAAKVNDQLLRKDPEGADRQETRRRIVELYVLNGDIHRASTAYQLMPSAATYGLRYRAAEQIARDLLDRDGRESRPRDHRLLAMAQEGLAPGDQAALAESIANYRAALKGDPADVISAGRLARLLQERKNDPTGAVQVLDDLIRAVPRSSEARLIRHRYFAGVHRNDLAAIELEKATELKKDNLDVRLAAADDALLRNDTATAKRHLDGLPESMQSDLRVRMMRGRIEFGEERPDEAVDSWRQGLLMIGGTDADLTWQLAHVLLRMGRIGEARPLVAQYHRLSGDGTRPLDRFLQAELDEKSGRPARAIVDLEWTRDRIGEFWKPMVLLALGRCHEALWDQTKAMEAYRRAIQIDPRSAEARLAIARLLSRKPDEAILEIEQGLEKTPDDLSLLIALAEARLKEQSARPADRRSWDDFDKTLRRASKASPTNSALIVMRAERLSSTGDLPGAIALLEESARQASHNSSLWTAWAQGLVRSGKPEEALKVLDRAAAPGAVGDHASIRIPRSKILLELGRGREAREGLIRGVEALPLADRPLLWEAVGRLDFSRGDTRSARASFTEWAKLLPDDPRPRLALLELAQGSGDESAVHTIIETLQALGGPQDVAWRLCRSLELLWTLNSTGQPAHRRDSRLLEANRIVDSVLADAPGLPSAHMLKGDILAKLNRHDDAIASYRRAWDRGTLVALPKLIELLIRRERFDDLNSLRLKVDPVDLDRLSAAASLRIGDAETTGRFVQQAVKEAKNSPESLAWQARVFESIARPDQADAALRAVTDQKPTELMPWLDLLRSLAKHGKAAEVSATIERARGLIKTDDPGVLEARLRWAAGDRPAADLAFEKALTRRGNDAELRILASTYYNETGRPAAAADCLNGALRIDPRNRGAARQMAVDLASDPATWPRAAEMFGVVTRVDDTAEDRLARAMIMAKAPDATRKSQAIGLYQALVEDLPGDNDIATAARSQLATLLLAANQPEKASEVAMVNARSSTDAPTIALYVETLLRAGKLPEARRQLDRLATIKPGDPAEAVLRVRWLRLSSTPDRLAEAMEDAIRNRLEQPGGEAFEREVFNALVEMGPPAIDRADRVGRAAAKRRADASWMPAQVLAGRGKAAEALALCRPSIGSPALEDRWGAAKVAMTVAIQNESDADLLAQVDRVMDPISKRDPKNYALTVMSAMLRHLQGRYEEEAGLYREALALQPGDARTTSNLAWILSEGLKRPDEALTLIDALIAKVGRMPELLDTRGVILNRLGRLDDAIVDLVESVHSAPSAIGHFHLAVACRKAGRDADFRKNRELAMKAGLSPLQVDRTERPEVASMMQR